MKWNKDAQFVGVLVVLVALGYFALGIPSPQYNPHQDFTEISQQGCVDLFGSPLGTSVTSPMYQREGNVILSTNLRVSDCAQMRDGCSMMCNQSRISKGIGAISEVSNPVVLSYLNGQVERYSYDYSCECYTNVR